jgi:hypothetical protein
LRPNDLCQASVHWQQYVVKVERSFYKIVELIVVSIPHCEDCEAYDRVTPATWMSPPTSWWPIERYACDEHVERFRHADAKAASKSGRPTRTKWVEVEHVVMVRELAAVWKTRQDEKKP